MAHGVGHPKARFNNVLFSINLNQYMPYIALFLKIKGKISERRRSPLLEPRVVTHI